jgi:hypothetical protein
MKFFYPAMQVHRRKKADQAQVMISMQMGDEDMIYLIKFYFIPVKLRLRALPAINKIKTLIDIKQLR